MIRAFIFDCFGVLTTDTWRAFIDSLPPGADIDRARELNQQLDAGYISHSEFQKQVHEATGAYPTEVEKLKSNEIAKNLPLMQYIGELKQSYKIGLLSNVASPWITDSFLTKEEQALFDEMVFSYQVGMTKPDPRIFQLICDRLDVDPREAVLIDDLERYTAAAREQGMQAITYDNLSQLKQQLEILLNHK